MYGTQNLSERDDMFTPDGKLDFNKRIGLSKSEDPLLQQMFMPVVNVLDPKMFKDEETKDDEDED